MVETIERTLATEKNPGPPQTSVHEVKRSQRFPVQGIIRFDTKYVPMAGILRVLSRPISAEPAGCPLAIIETANSSLPLTRSLALAFLKIQLDFKPTSAKTTFGARLFLPGGRGR
jgi:hypothetical protein